jgi:hypothetical protein
MQRPFSSNFSDKLKKNIPLIQEATGSNRDYDPYKLDNYNPPFSAAQYIEESFLHLVVVSPVFLDLLQRHGSVLSQFRF